jgi:hypothetical protein
MKSNFKIDKLLSNKTLLNVVTGVTFLNIIGFIMLNQTSSVIYFILIGLVTSLFSKNMIIILLVPLIMVNFIIASSLTSKNSNHREGLETIENNGKKDDSDKKKADSKVTNTKQTTSSSTNQGLPITPLDHNENNNMQPSERNAEVDESFEVGRGKKNSKGYNIDYASTVEDAYDELNKILGSDGIKRLTTDTQSLMKQQLKLAESMKSMEPLISGIAPLMQQAQGLLGSINSGGGDLGSLADIAKQFTSGLGQN